jgi:hypothetical protein
MAASGRYEEGVELADSLPEPLMKGRVLADIAHRAARRGDFGTAVRTGAAIGHSERSRPKRPTPSARKTGPVCGTATSSRRRPKDEATARGAVRRPP